MKVLPLPPRQELVFHLQTLGGCGGVAAIWHPEQPADAATNVEIIGVEASHPDIILIARPEQSHEGISADREAFTWPPVSLVPPAAEVLRPPAWTWMTGFQWSLQLGAFWRSSITLSGLMQTLLLLVMRAVPHCSSFKVPPATVARYEGC